MLLIFDKRCSWQIIKVTTLGASPGIIASAATTKETHPYRCAVNGIDPGTGGTYYFDEFESRLGGWWDANKIGLSPPLIQTPEGWLMIDHGVKQNGSGVIYRLGFALFDLNNPECCLKRGDEWVFAPEASYERHGDVDKVVFPCGYTLAPDGDTLRIYYGAADTSVAMATGSIGRLLHWLYGEN